jgi:hypothetical protein
MTSFANVFLGLPGEEERDSPPVVGTYPDCTASIPSLISSAWVPQECFPAPFFLIDRVISFFNRVELVGEEEEERG